MAAAAGESESDEFIKVAVRIRPPADIYGGNGKLCVTAGDDQRSISLLQPNKGERVFAFDAVFDDQTTQETVFTNIGKHIIEGCVDGYNGTIFAYGQTGSGKTYTVFGPPAGEDGVDQGRRGLIPRCIEYLFTLLERKQEAHGDAFKYLCKCAFIELYNERLYDLLVPSSSSQLKLRVDMKRGVFVEGAVEEIVSTTSEVHKVLEAGGMNRRIGETRMNRESSRSHAVFILEIETQEMVGDLVNHKVARLNLVDLAGSERQKDAQSDGTALKEASSINKSLSFLGRVIRSLSRKVIPGQPPVFVPYRDSQLTYLLRDSLGGNARTAVVANVHQNLRFYEETVSTLKFAEEVKKVRNRAVANENVSGENVTVLLREIERLKGELRRVNANSPRVVEIPTEEELTQLRTDRARLEKALRASEIENGELREKCEARERAWEDMSKELATSVEDNVALRSKVEALQVLLEEQIDQPLTIPTSVEQQRDDRAALIKSRVSRQRSSSSSTDMVALQRKLAQLTEKSKDFDILMEECAKMREEQHRNQLKYDSLKADCQTAMAERKIALDDMAKFEEDCKRAAQVQAADHAKLQDKIAELEHRLLEETESAVERQMNADAEIAELKAMNEDLQSRLTDAQKHAMMWASKSERRKTRSMARTSVAVDPEVRALRDQLDEQTDVISALETALDEKTSQCAQLEAELALVKDDAAIKRESAVFEQENKYKQKIEQFQREFDVNSESLKATSIKMSLIEQDRLKAENLLREQQEKNDVLVKRLESSERHCEQLKDTAARLEAIEKRSFAEKDALRSDVETLKEEKLNLNNVIIQLRQKIEEEQAENARLASHANPRQKIHYVDDLRMKNAKLEQDMAEMKKELSTLRHGEQPVSRGPKHRYPLRGGASGSQRSLASNSSTEGKENVGLKPRN